MNAVSGVDQDVQGDKVVKDLLGALDDQILQNGTVSAWLIWFHFAGYDDYDDPAIHG